MNFKKTVAIVAAAGALTALAIPAMADITPYGSIRLLTYYDVTKPATTGSYTNYGEPLANTSRFGVRASDGALGAQVEFGLNGGNLGATYTAADTAFVYTRLMLATYKFDAGTLLVGQDYNKYWVPSARVFAGDDPNNGYGALYDGRQPQLRFTLANGLYVAAIKPAVNGSSTLAIKLPKLNVGYDGAAGNVKFGGGAAYQTYTDKTIKKDVSTYLLYAKLGAVFGPAEIRGNLGYGQNLGNAGFTNTTNAANATNGMYSGATDKDATTISGYVQGSFTVSPSLKLNAIYGYTSSDRDDFKKADASSSTTLNANITVAKNFTITPEITIIDNMKDSAGVKQAKDTFIGARWQLDF